MASCKEKRDHMKDNLIILGTKSQFRIELFKKLGLDFINMDSDVDEKDGDRPGNPVELSAYLARRKADSVCKKVGGDKSRGFVIGFDSVGEFNGNLLEKPKSEAEAFQRLLEISGKNVLFHTGIHIIDLKENRRLSDVVTNENKVRRLSKKEIEFYLKQKDNRCTSHSLGFDPTNSYSATFIKEINGESYNTSHGLPLSRIIEMLKELGYQCGV